MPAIVAHLLIARETLTAVAADPGLAPLHAKLAPYENYVLLGALGPDLPYYSFNSLREFLAKELPAEEFFNDLPEGVDQWSYQLHSKQPNIFPLTLFDLIYRDDKIDSKTAWDDQLLEKLKAFTFGYLTHMAADQRIHPLVNHFAGPYYLHAENRKVHRNCEIHQDVFLYHDILPDRDFSHEDFLSWIQTGFGRDNEEGDSFSAYLQKAFVEAHGVTPPADAIRDWVGGVEDFAAHLNNRKLFFRMPHAAVWEEFRAGKKEAERQRFFVGCNYRAEYFDKAAQIAVAYFRAANDYCTQMEARPTTYEDIRKAFWKKILRADLLSPLEDVYALTVAPGAR